MSWTHFISIPWVIFYGGWFVSWFKALRFDKVAICNLLCSPQNMKHQGSTVQMSGKNMMHFTRHVFVFYLSYLHVFDWQGLSTKHDKSLLWSVFVFSTFHPATWKSVMKSVIFMSFCGGAKIQTAENTKRQSTFVMFSLFHLATQRHKS